MTKQLPAFVYGTLRNGFGNYERLLKGRTVAEHAAITKGTMFSVGGFPALINEFEQPIKGELMYIEPEKYEEVLRSLDWLEGYDRRDPKRSMYLREKVQVWNESTGQMVEAWVYYWNRSVKGLEYVKSGCWREYKGAKN